MTTSVDKTASLNHLQSFIEAHLSTVWASIDLEHCLHVLQTVNHFDRWNSFDKFKHTHQYLKTAYAQAGAQSECVPIPATQRTGDGTWTLGHSFIVKHAQIRVGNTIIADYHDNPWHVTHYTSGTPKGGISGSLHIVDTDEDLSLFSQLDNSIRNQSIILTSRSLMREATMWREQKALAVISDEPVKDYPDAVNWGKWHWGGPAYVDGQPSPLPSMILSQRQGAALRKRIHQGEALYATIDIQCDMSAPADHDVATALIPSQCTSREVWAMAHSAEPGVLDNASGVAASVECARLINSLQQEGQLPGLERGIRFINGFECFGFFGYYPNHPKNQRPVAGLNIDTVGAKLNACQGSFRWHETHKASASWVDTIGETISRAVLNHTGTPFTFLRKPFLSTEDTLLADPIHGFPLSWITNHPIKAYHSSSDDMSLLCPDSLRIAIAVSALHLSYLAILNEIELNRWNHDHCSAVLQNNTLNPLIRDSQIEASWDNAKLWYDTSPDLRTPTHPSKQTREGMGRIPLKVQIVSPSQENLPSTQLNIVRSFKQLPYNVLYLANGRRTLRDILSLINADNTVMDGDHLTNFFDAFEAIGFVTYV